MRPHSEPAAIKTAGVLLVKTGPLDLVEVNDIRLLAYIVVPITQMHPNTTRAIIRLRRLVVDGNT